MKVKVDLKEIERKIAMFERKAGKIQKPILKDIAILTERAMIEKVPVETGRLTSSIWLMFREDRIVVGPTVKYAKYPLFYGKRKSKHSTTYAQRTIVTVRKLMKPVIQAALEEHLRV